MHSSNKREIFTLVAKTNRPRKDYPRENEEE